MLRNGNSHVPARRLQFAEESGGEGPSRSGRSRESGIIIAVGMIPDPGRVPAVPASGWKSGWIQEFPFLSPAAHRGEQRDEISFCQRGVQTPDILDITPVMEYVHKMPQDPGLFKCHFPETGIASDQLIEKSPDRCRAGKRDLNLLLHHVAEHGKRLH